MYKIGEFSKITQVSIRMLRYYDEHDLLKPCLVDDFTGYRMYSAEQIEPLNRIILLKNMGFGVKEIKTMLANWDGVLLREDLLKQIEKTKENIQAEQDKLMQIQGFLADLDNQEKKLNIQVVMKRIPSYHVVSIRRVMENYFCEGQLWQELGEALGGLANEKTYSFSIYHDLDYREEDVDIEVCVEAGEDYKLKEDSLIYRQVESVPMAACFMIYGPYSNISVAYKEFAYWLEQHPAYRMAGENRQICHVSMCHTQNPEEYVTELQIPLAYQEKSMAESANHKL